MPRTFSYKDASKLNHKMASKYASCQDDEDAWKSYTTQNCWRDPPTLTYGSERAWVPLNKKELMTIPWMKEAVETKNAMLFIDDCSSYPIERVTDTGAIYLNKGQSLYDCHLRILKNIVKPSRYLMTCFKRYDGGEWKLDNNYPCNIRTATVSSNFDAFCYTDGEKKYYYSKDGKERLAKRIVYDDDYYCSCCCPEYDYESD
jgi:hypothetical protein